MRAERTTSRSASLVATAAALLALMAMTSSTSQAAVRRAVDLQSRTTLSESHMVRAMAAVMAAAARDLLVGDHHTTTVAVGPCLLLSEIYETTGQPELNSEPARLVRSVSLSERLLDLPPPIC